MRLLAAMLALMFCVTACGGNERQANETSSTPAASGPAVTTTSVSPPPVAPSPPPDAPAPFTVSSPAFAENTPIPAEYSCNGRNVPPPLRWENPPPGTEFLALVVDDPDAVGGLYIHWVVTGISPTASEIVDGALPAGAQVGPNSGGNARYLGPCPPAGSGLHHYRFQLYALNKPMTLATTPAQRAAQTISGAAIASATIVGLFSG